MFLPRSDVLQLRHTFDFVAAVAAPRAVVPLFSRRVISHVRQITAVQEASILHDPGVSRRVGESRVIEPEVELQCNPPARGQGRIETVDGETEFIVLEHRRLTAVEAQLPY